MATIYIDLDDYEDEVNEFIADNLESILEDNDAIKLKSGFQSIKDALARHDDPEAIADLCIHLGKQAEVSLDRFYLETGCNDVQDIEDLVKMAHPKLLLLETSAWEKVPVLRASECGRCGQKTALRINDMSEVRMITEGGARACIEFEKGIEGLLETIISNVCQTDQRWLISNLISFIKTMNE